jgi:probable rRNA maturation factor
VSESLLNVVPQDETGTLSDAELAGLCDAVRAALEVGGATHAAVDLAVVGDAAMHALNRRWLDHDYTTDVLSFLLEEGGAGEPLEGQVIVNPDEAARRAAEHQWPIGNQPGGERPAALRELTLYAAHGTLHLCGMDDATAEQRAEMRRAETAALAACEIAVPPGHAGSETDSGGVPAGVVG